MATPTLLENPDRSQPTCAPQACSCRGAARPAAKQFHLLMLAQASFGYAFSSFLLLPKFLVTELAAGPQEIGLMMAAFGITAIAGLPLVGTLVDRFGRTRFLTAGGTLMAVASLAYVSIDRFDVALLGLRAIQGIAFAMVFVAGATLAVDEAPPERLGHTLGLFGLAMLSMNAVAPALTEMIVARGGWAPAFVCAAAGASLCAVVSLTLVDRNTSPGADVPGLLQVIGRPVHIRIGTIVALVGTAFGTMMVYHQPLALVRGMTELSGFFITYTAAAIVVRVGFGRFIDRAGHRRVTLASLVLYAGVTIAMMELRPATLLPLAAVFGLAHGLFYPAFNALAIAGCSEHERGKLMAIFQGAFQVGWAGGTFALGLVAERAGYPVVFGVAGLCVLLALGLLIMTTIPRPALTALAPITCVCGTASSAHPGRPARGHPPSP